MRRSPLQPSKFCYGQLEKRTLLAGVVYVSLVDQVLTVNGDHQTNIFSVDLNAETTDQLVQGQSGTDIQFTKGFGNGYNLQDLEDVRIYANTGDDVVTLYAEGFSLRDDLIISLAHGNDSLYIVGGSVEDDVSIYGGSNHDSISISDLHVGDDLYLVGNAGSDVMTLNNTIVEDNTLGLGQLGHDIVLVNDSSFGDGVYFEMGDGADRYESVESSYSSVVSIRGRQGYDSVLLPDSNDLASPKHLFQVEREAVLPNETGRAEAAIAQTKSDFFQFGRGMPATTGNGVQDGLTQLASAFDVSLFKLDMNSNLQTVSVNDPTETVSVIWDSAVQSAVAATGPGPTIASRAYAILHTAMYDAWSAYDGLAVSTTLADDLQRPTAENTDANKTEAMSFAAFRVLDDLFSTQTELFENVMERIGFDSSITTTDLTTPSGIGNRMAEALLATAHNDGSNQLGDSQAGTPNVAYSDTSGYTPVNPVGGPTDIEAWTPEYVPVDASPATADRIQHFLTPHWGSVDAFGFESSDDYLPGAPQPFLLVEATVDLDAQTITLTNGSVLPIHKNLIGTVINPEFISQAQEVVQYSANLTDRQKLIAEFWEDGGGTSFPPGTNMTFGQFISARENHSIDQDAQMFFALGNAVFDAGVATWNAKVEYDYARPVRVIRELGELGLIGEFNSELGGYAIEAWTADNGTQMILANQFLSYQLPTSDVSPPFAEYTSGHSAFSAAGSAILRLFTGSDDFGASVTFKAGTSLFEPGITPESEVTLAWDTFTAAADEAGLSRLYGGIHFTEGDINGRTLGEDVADAVWEQAQFYINGGV